MNHTKRKVLIVGSGGREHAFQWKLASSPYAELVYVAPGNGGTQNNVEQLQPTDMEGVVAFAKKNHCFTLVGPELPLSLGMVDLLESEGLPVFGPTKEQARLETSKVFAKHFMRAHSIPTAEFGNFNDTQAALDFAARFGGQVAVKADGLASGKGVFVCSNLWEAEAAIRSILEKKIFGEIAGKWIVVEERLEGREVSLMTLCDGRKAVPFGTAVDHKRLLDGDHGPNTGGMGAYSPALNLPPDFVAEVMREIILPTVEATGFRGFLYAGLMLTDSGIMVLEFNARMGDPETQVILPRLKSDLLELLIEVTDDRDVGFEESSLAWSTDYCCAIAMCASGYPEKVRTGDLISGLDAVTSGTQQLIFHSGTRKVGDNYFTSGGRVLYVVSRGKSLEDASLRAYSACGQISWPGEHHRTDIGKLVSQIVN